MVHDLLLIFQSWLCRANVHSFIYLHGVADNDFGIAIGQCSGHGRVALAACSWAKYDYWFAIVTHLVANSLHRKMHFVCWRGTHINERARKMEPCCVFNAHRGVRTHAQ